jgi:hypothetical protein
MRMNDVKLGALLLLLTLLFAYGLAPLGRRIRAYAAEQRAGSALHASESARLELLFGAPRRARSPGS